MKKEIQILLGMRKEKILVIDSGPISINGINQSGDKYRFDKGKCFGVEVPLGEIQTDGKGRL